MPNPLRRCTALLSLAGFLTAIVGVPVLTPMFGPGGKDLSQPFPCMHSHCGCQSAEGCWRGCCCHTEGEKLAWAKASGVEPPEYVVAAAAKEAKGLTTACEGHDWCCSSQAETANCCASSDACEAAGEAVPDWQWLPALAARKCQGLPQLWLLLSSASPTAPRFQWRPAPLESGRILLVSDASTSHPLPPDTPPPRA